MLTQCRINRRCNKDTVVNGIPIKEGCLVAVPLYYLHYRSDCWTDPEQFNPERCEMRTHMHVHPWAHTCIAFYSFCAVGSASPRSPPSTLVPSSHLGVGPGPALAHDWRIWRPRWHSLKCSASSGLWRHQRLRWFSHAYILYTRSFCNPGEH